jgi:hypothetical protein
MRGVLYGEGGVVCGLPGDLRRNELAMRMPREVLDEVLHVAECERLLPVLPRIRVQQARYHAHRSAGVHNHDDRRRDETPIAERRLFRDDINFTNSIANDGHEVYCSPGLNAIDELTPAGMA